MSCYRNQGGDIFKRLNQLSCFKCQNKVKCHQAKLIMVRIWEVHNFSEVLRRKLQAMKGKEAVGGKNTERRDIVDQREMQCESEMYPWRGRECYTTQPLTVQGYGLELPCAMLSRSVVSDSL